MKIVTPLKRKCIIDGMFPRYTSLIIFSLLLSVVIAHPASAEDPPSNATSFNHQMALIQGDSPDSAEVIESVNTMRIREGASYVIPWDESRIYIHVPEGGAVKYINDGSHKFAGNWGPSDLYDEWYFWEFAPGDDRRVYDFVNYNLSILGEGTYDDNMLEVNENNISLKIGITYGEYISNISTSADMVNILSARPIFQSNSDNTSIMLSNDNGTTWVTGDVNKTINFTSDGTGLMFKAILSDGQVASPRISNITLEYTFMSIRSTIVNLDSEYSIQGEEDPVTIVFNKKFLYDVGKIDILMHYDLNLSANSSNVDWMPHYDINDQMIEFFTISGKNFHIGSANKSNLITISVGENVTGNIGINPHDDGDEPNYYLYSIIAVIMIVSMTGLYLSRKDPGQETEGTDVDEDTSDNTEDGESEEKGIPEEAGTVEGENELIEQKDNILKAIKKLDADLESGEISKDVHAELKANYKKEAVRIMKELDNQ